MPFLAPFVAAVGAAAATLGITTSMVVNFVINIALALIQMAMTKQPKPSDGIIVVRESVGIRQVVLGRSRVYGKIIFIESNTRILYQVLYLSQGPVDGFEEYFLDNRTALLDADGWVTSKPYGSNGRKRVRVLTRAGAVPSSVYEPLKLAFPGTVNNAWRGDGMATMFVQAKSLDPEFIAKHYPNRYPQGSVIARFGSVYDPRTGSRAWSQNLPLHLLEYLTADDGMGIAQKDVDPSDARLPANDLIDLDDFAFAARVADNLIPGKNGTSVRRYQGSFSWRLDEQPKDVLSRAVMMMDGQLFLKASGKIGFRIGRWEEPSIHIEDTDIIDANIRDASDPVSEANEIVIKYTNPNANYSPATSDPWRNEEVYRRTGGRYRNTTVELYGIQNHNHARRIAKIIDRKTNAKWQGSITTNFVGVLAWDQRFIRVTYEDLGIEAESFEIRNIAIDEEEQTVTIEIASADATMYDFDPATEEGTEPVNPSALGDDAVPTPQNLAIEWSAETVRRERVITVALSVDVPRRNTNDPADDDADNDDVVAEWQYARADTGKWRTVTVNDKDMQVEIEGLKETRLYDFRVRFRTSSSEPGDWLLSENQRAIDPVAPGVPTKVRGSVVAPVGGGKSVIVAATAPADLQTASLLLYRNTENRAKGAAFVQEIECDRNEAVSFTDANPKTGARWYFVRAANGSGVLGRAVPVINNPMRI